MYESTTVIITPQKALQKSSTAVNNFMDQLVAKNPGEPEFHQAVREVVEWVMPVVESTPVPR